MSRRVAIAILPALLLLAVAAPAGAGTTVTKVPTAVEIENLFAADPYAVAAGNVTADDPRCLDNRQVAITVIDKDDEPFAFDVARTGESGGWTGIHDLAPIQDRAPLQAVKVKVRKRKVAISKSKALVCQAKRTSISLF